MSGRPHTRDRFEWTPARVATVKAVAGVGGTASEAAEAVGLAPERTHLIYRLAKQRGFVFTNLGRKRDDRTLLVRIDERASAALSERARRHGMARRDLAAQLLSIVLLQGPVFIDNLLDDRD